MHRPVRQTLIVLTEISDPIRAADGEKLIQFRYLQHSQL